MDGLVVQGKSYELRHSLASKPATLTSGGKQDYFSASGNSGTFVKGITGSSGVEEDSIQAYAILSGTPFTVKDPSMGILQ